MPKTSQMVPNSNGRKPLRTTTATLRNTTTSMPNGLAGCHPLVPSLPLGGGAGLVGPADARDGEDPGLEQRPGGRIGAERGQRFPADADGDDPAAAVLRAEPGQHLTARAVQEGE